MKLLLLLICIIWCLYVSGIDDRRPSYRRARGRQPKYRQQRPGDDDDTAQSKESSFEYRRQQFIGSTHVQNGQSSTPLSHGTGTGAHPTAPKLNSNLNEKTVPIRTPIVQQYTSNILVKAGVALSAAFSSFVLMHFVTGLTINSSPLWLKLSTSLLFFTAAFTQTNVGELSRAQGVLLILLIRRAKLITYFTEVFVQLSASLGLGKRKAYPPGPNPWRYQPQSSSDPAFNVYLSGICVILAASVLGNMLVRPIPLFPGWIGSLMSATCIAYIYTFRTPHGDLLRFLGSSIVNSLSTMSGAADETDYFGKAGIVSGQIFFFVGKLDRKYKIKDKLTEVTRVVSNVIKSNMNRVHADMEDTSDDVP
jgi:hypothetical protein